MTDQDETRRSGVLDALDPLGGFDAADDRSDDDDDEMPEHEIDDDRTIGGGILGAGGTAIDRGTGTLDGQAQDADPDDENRVTADPGLVRGGEADFGAETADRAIGGDR